VASQKLVEIVRAGRLRLAKWRRDNPDVLLDLTEADLHDADLRNMNLRRADLTGANLRGSDLSGAQLTEAHLVRADLRTARLIRTDLTSSKMKTATLEESDARQATFRDADLTQVNLSQSDLARAVMCGARLRNAILREACLTGATFRGTVLAGADLTEATIGWTLLDGLDLTAVIGLDQVRHIGPSPITFDTALRSHARLSRSFLQGCGVPEGVLADWDRLFGHPNENIICFIRYAPDDASFARQLAERAQKKGVRCWLDEFPAKATERRVHRSSTSFETRERVVLCASKASLTSAWVNEEIERVLAREEQLKADTGQPERLFYPLNLDGFMFSGDWKHKREKQIAKLAQDFVGWRRNEEKLDQELTKLLQTMTGTK